MASPFASLDARDRLVILQFQQASVSLDPETGSLSEVVASCGAEMCVKILLSERLFCRTWQ